MSRILIVADRDLPDVEAIEAVKDAHVLIVAPAGPVAGERWIIDLTARERAAQERLETWRAVLAPHAVRVDGEVGHADVRAAVEDASAAFGPERVVIGEATVPRPRFARPARPAARRARAVAL